MPPADPPDNFTESVKSYGRLVLVGLLILACPCEMVHRRTSVISSSLVLLQCHTSFVRFI